MSSFTQAFSKSGAVAPYAYFYQAGSNTYWRPDTHVGEAYNLAHWDNYATAATVGLAPGDWTVTISVTSIPDGVWELVIRDKAGVARDPAVDSFIATRQVTFRGESAVGASWTYADQSDVERLIGALNLAIVSDLDDDNVLDSDTIQADGEWSDSYINLQLRLGGATVPLTGMDATTSAAVRDISAHLTAWYLFHHRGLTDRQGGQISDAVAGVMEGYKTYADEQLEKLSTILQEAASDEGETITAVQAIVPTREQGCWPGNGWY